MTEDDLPDWKEAFALASRYDPLNCAIAHEVEIDGVDGDCGNWKGFGHGVHAPGQAGGQVFLPQLSPALASKAAPLDCQS